MKDDHTISEPENVLVGAGEDTMNYIKEKNNRDYGSYGFFKVVIRENNAGGAHAAHRSGLISRLIKK